MTRIELKQTAVVFGFAAIAFALGVYLPENFCQGHPADAFFYRVDGVMFAVMPWPPRLYAWMRS